MKSFRLALLGAGAVLPACLFGSCFTGGTQVATRGGSRRISRMKAGESVLSYDVDSRELVEKRILRVFRHGPKEFGALSGTPLTGVTANHPVFDTASGSFRRADELGENQGVLFLDRGEVSQSQVVGFRPSQAGMEPVYNLAIEGTHTYFAEGVLVHNKDWDPHGCRVYAPGSGQSCNDTVAVGPRDLFEVYSAEAACTLIADSASLGFGGAGGAGAEETDEQNVLHCPSPGVPVSELSKEVYLRVQQGQESELLCEESTLVLANLSGPIRVDVFLDGRDCAALGQSLFSMLVGEDGGEVPLPQVRGSTLLRLTPQGTAPLHATVSTGRK